MSAYARFLAVGKGFRHATPGASLGPASSQSCEGDFNIRDKLSCVALRRREVREARFVAGQHEKSLYLVVAARSSDCNELPSSFS
jgi:hypothetical protein